MKNLKHHNNTVKTSYFDGSTISKIVNFRSETLSKTRLEQECSKKGPSGDLMPTFGAKVTPKVAPRQPKGPKRSPKASPGTPKNHAKVAFRPEVSLYPRTCVQGVPPRTKKVAFLMGFGSFFKVFYPIMCVQGGGTVPTKRRAFRLVF